MTNSSRPQVRSGYIVCVFIFCGHTLLNQSWLTHQMFHSNDSNLSCFIFRVNNSNVQSNTTNINETTFLAVSLKYNFKRFLIVRTSFFNFLVIVWPQFQLFILLRYQTSAHVATSVTSGTHSIIVNATESIRTSTGMRVIQSRIDIAYLNNPAITAAPGTN